MAKTFLSLWVLLLSTGSPRAGAVHWLDLPKWNDGWAEVALYEGKVLKYGALRKSTLEIVTVREHFDPRKLVKTRPAPGKEVLPVMKTNLVRRVRTGVYEYVQMASVFQRRDTGKLVKLATTSSEWCGTSFALFEDRGEGGRLTISNYMDDQGTSAHPDPASGGAVFEDELIPYLRQHLDDLESGSAFVMVRSLLSNNPRYRKAEARIASIEDAPLETGGSKATRQIVLDTGDEKQTFLFSRDGVRPLLRWENDRGEHYRLAGRSFMDYWNRNRPGDEKLLEEIRTSESEEPIPEGKGRLD